MNDLLILGAGGHGREAAWIAAAAGRLVPRAFVVDREYQREGRVDGLPVLVLDEAIVRYPAATFVAAVGDPALRETLAARAEARNLMCASLVHPTVVLGPHTEVGKGAIIAAGVVLSTRVAFGMHVHVNLACSVSHDVELDDFATLSPGVHVAGWVRIGRGARLGVGSVVMNGEPGRPLSIGAGATIGAGACVTRDVPAGVTAVGVPARPIVSRPTA